jgi:hypothetical protein
MGYDKQKYQDTLIQHYNVLISKIEQENENLLSQSNGPDGTVSVDKRNTYYYNETRNTLITAYTVLLILYIVSAIVISIFILYKPYAIETKVGLIAVLLLFPMYVMYAEKIVLSIGDYVYKYIFSYAYMNGYDINPDIIE